MKLSNAVIEKLQHTHRGKGLIKDSATPQLYLKVGATGAASWVRIIQAGGKRTETVIGHFPKHSLHEARGKLGAVTGAAAHRGSMTVAAAVERYLAERGKVLSRKTMRDLTHYLQKDLAPLSTRPLTEFTRDVVKALVKDRAVEHPGSGRRLYAACRTFSWWCADNSLLDNDPLAAMRTKGLLPKPVERERTLTESEVRALMNAEGEKARILQFALLTGQRIGEVLQIDSDQIDSDHWWTVPAAIRKVRRENRVYLSEEARKVYGKEGLYQYSYGAMWFYIDREGAGWNIHDLRRTAATLMQECDVRYDIVARALGQQLGGRLVATYQRGEQRSAVKAAFEMLGQRVSGIVAG